MQDAYARFPDDPESLSLLGWHWTEPDTVPVRENGHPATALYSHRTIQVPEPGSCQRALFVRLPDVDDQLAALAGYGSTMELYGALGIDPSRAWHQGSQWMTFALHDDTPPPEGVDGLLFAPPPS